VHPPNSCGGVCTTFPIPQSEVVPSRLLWAAPIGILIWAQAADSLLRHKFMEEMLDVDTEAIAK
jgi:hypothetical protein